MLELGVLACNWPQPSCAVTFQPCPCMHDMSLCSCRRC
jgi:hypothetical protein